MPHSPEITSVSFAILHVASRSIIHSEEVVTGAGSSEEGGSEVTLADALGKLNAEVEGRIPAGKRFCLLVYDGLWFDKTIFAAATSKGLELPDYFVGFGEAARGLPFFV